MMQDLICKPLVREFEYRSIEEIFQNRGALKKFKGKLYAKVFKDENDNQYYLEEETQVCSFCSGISGKLFELSYGEKPLKLALSEKNEFIIANDRSKDEKSKEHKPAILFEECIISESNCVFPLINAIKGKKLDLDLEELWHRTWGNEVKQQTLDDLVEEGCFPLYFNNYSNIRRVIDTYHLNSLRLPMDVNGFNYDTALTEKISHYQNITSLILDSQVFDTNPASLSRVNLADTTCMKILAKIPHLVDLQMYWCSVDIRDMKWIGQSTTLRSLTMSACNLSVGCIHSLAQNNHMSHLTIRGNRVDSMPRLRESMKDSYQPYELGSEEAKKIAVGMKAITSLDLSDNPISDKGATALAKKGKKRRGPENQPLASLIADNCHIGFDGCIALRSSENLLTLSLNDNFLNGIQADEAIAELSNSKSITQLYVARNELGDGAAYFLAKMAQLTELDISSNQLHEEGIKYLEGMSQLNFLDISFNPIHWEGFTRLVQNGKLRALHALDCFKPEEEKLSAVKIGKNLVDLSPLPSKGIPNVNNMLRNRRGVLHNWQMVTILLASYRTNQKSDIRDSILALLPDIRKFISDQGVEKVGEKELKIDSFSSSSSSASSQSEGNSVSVDTLPSLTRIGSLNSNMVASEEEEPEVKRFHVGPS